jgi:hypothetical protein
LDNPDILILALENGKANYDIAKSSGEEVNTDEGQDSDGSSALSIGIKRWSITNGKVGYFDAATKFYVVLSELNHEGSGDFTLDVFDMRTSTSINNVSLGFEGVEYLSNKRVNADINLNMDLDAMKFSFLENKIAVNDFNMEADGFVSMPGEDIEMDITFGGQEISLKSVLSLIPGVYQEYLAGVSASGDIGFDGFIKGVYNENSMPQIAANLTVNDGSIRYAEYNIPMEEITIESSFSYPSADLSETEFNVDKFHMLLDGEEVSAYLKFRDLIDYQWEFGFDGNADLEKITKVVPLEGMTLKGKINAKLNTKGKMSDVEAEQYENLPTGNQ